MLDIIDCALAALGDARTIRQHGASSKIEAIEKLARLRNEIQPQKPQQTKLKILREIETYVRRFDMIPDELWDRDEPIEAIYQWCATEFGKTPNFFDDIADYVQDALHELELD